MSKEINLFGDEEFDWREEWKDMPEFIQEEQRPFAQIIFRFANENDLEEFSKLIGQKLNCHTKSSWFPFRSHWGSEDALKRYMSNK